jgi:hypothetical protein
MENSFFHLFVRFVHLITFYNVFGCLALDNLNKAIKKPMAFNINIPGSLLPSPILLTSSTT